MAEKTRKMFNKKWVVAIAILVFVAIVVTTVLLLLPKNTRNIVEKVNQQESAMFLVDDEQQALFNSFEGKIRGVENNYLIEAQTAETVANSMHDMLSFYNQFLYYSVDDGVFQDNYGTIDSGLDKAESAEGRMNDILVRVNETVQVGATNYIRTAWRDFRSAFIDYVDGYAKAFAGLSNVFESSLAKGPVQNSMTYYVLDTTNYLLEDIVESYREIYNLESNGETSEYAFRGAQKVSKFANLVTTYLSDMTQITRYNYSQTLQDQISLVGRFEEVYGESIEKVVASITTDGNIAYEAISADEGGQILSAVKNLIDGGVKA